MSVHRGIGAGHVGTGTILSPDDLQVARIFSSSRSGIGVHVPLITFMGTRNLPSLTPNLQTLNPAGVRGSHDRVADRGVFV